MGMYHPTNHKDSLSLAAKADEDLAVGKANRRVLKESIQVTEGIGEEISFLWGWTIVFQWSHGVPMDWFGKYYLHHPGIYLNIYIYIYMNMFIWYIFIWTLSDRGFEASYLESFDEFSVKKIGCLVPHLGLVPLPFSQWFYVSHRIHRTGICTYVFMVNVG